jgi:hypothetical protein
LDVELAVKMLEEVSRQDLEDCESAIGAADKEKALAAVERAFAKIDTVIDMLRSSH